MQEEDGNLNAMPAQPHTLWQKPPGMFGDIPEPLYRLRLSVLNDNEGYGDCPSRMFVFKNLDNLTTATNKIDDVFGGGFSEYKISKSGVEAPANEGGRLGCGRTENVTIAYDSVTADESWKEFLKRLDKVKHGWTTEVQWEMDTFKM
ncbi:hypothetical protein MMC12_002182 [Toensbergia leucococca]|nr:hypothetical protein [Toensbergia leucococca]